MKYTTSEEEVNVKKEVENKRKVDHLALGIAYGCSFGLMIGTCLWPFFGFIIVVYALIIVGPFFDSLSFIALIRWLISEPFLSFEK